MSDDDEISPDEGIIHQAEGIDLLSANIELSDLELRLVSATCRERVLSTYIEQIKERYDYVLIDCMPSLGMITLNAFASADSVIVPVQAHYLPLKGMTQLTKTISQVQHKINPKLKIDGIVLTLVAEKTNLAKTTEQTIKEYYGSKLKIFDTKIPMAIKCAEISIVGKSIYGFTDEQKERLAELLSEDNKKLWNSILY